MRIPMESTLDSNNNGQPSTKLGRTNAADEITCVSQVIGEAGRWQWKFFAIFCGVYFVNVFHNFAILFYTARSDFWCRDSLTGNMTAADWQRVRNQCVDGCSSYQVDTSQYRKTLTSEFELVCSRGWMLSATGSSYQFGYMISSLLVGYFSDRFGRKPVLKAVVLMEILMCLVQALAPNIYVFLVAQVLLGIFAYGKFLTGLLLMMETAGPRTKSLMQTLCEFSWSAAVMIFLCLFYISSDFRHMKLISSGIGLVMVLLFPQIPESIRWLFSKGRYEEARAMLVMAAKYNAQGHREYDPVEVDRKIDSLVKHFDDQELLNREQRKKTLLDLWGSRMLPVCLCLYICWFTNNMVGYAIAYNQADFGSNLIMNSAIFQVASLISYAVLYLLIERVNRRLIGQCSYLALFVTCIAVALSFYGEGLDRGELVRETPRGEVNHFRVVMGMLMRFGSTFGFQIIYLLSVESFPTLMRQLGIGTCSFISRFASIAAPFTRELGSMFGLPFVYSLFASLALLASLAVSCVPETRGKEIPNTLQECLERRKRSKPDSGVETSKHI